MNVAALIDFQRKDQQQIENLHRKMLLEKSHVLTYANFTKTKEADVEDMFEVDFYCDLLSKTYHNLLATPVDPSKLPPGNRIAVRAEKYFNDTNPLTPPHTYEHFGPSSYFIEHLAALKGSISAATLDRFEAAFQQLNALLPK